ncbi:MAG: bifunctional diaminohydroxyphosphoribosylaminopyrimidine deaminase/5-amino-6-(5-phosphoribosylamino)uracil reductase RibD [Beijerinckiaceae bacterium]|nr:bifunctional diaminohydroxyphosphoribosylaminopyrimidine deaminase/5-amino-6-(5-phosphoribosylamino)uracil reductase RibD [Beijerinckiaceae bacterium]
MTHAPTPASASAPSREDDERFMRAAIALGRRWQGSTSPNPSVGSIVVRDGVIVGRGATKPGGRPHAETVAIMDAGDKAKGATIYVSLEPCSHFGRTPPCAQTIISSGIARVVSALEDPDLRVAGRGHKMLRDAGLEVTEGVCAREALRANLGHILRVSQKRPMVTLKLAETADGFAAGGAHDPRLAITGAAANNSVHVMRAMHDAIMVGAGTVLADDPLMTVRLPGLENRRPLRVVLDTELSISPRSRLVATAREYPVLVICGPKASPSAQAELESHGVQVVHCRPGADGRLDLFAALQLLSERGLTRVFSEGGPSVGSGLVLSGLVEDVVLFTNERPLGRPGTPSLSKEARAALTDGARYRLVEDARLGADRLRRFERID